MEPIFSGPIAAIAFFVCLSCLIVLFALLLLVVLLRPNISYTIRTDRTTRRRDYPMDAASYRSVTAGMLDSDAEITTMDTIDADDYSLE